MEIIKALSLLTTLLFATNAVAISYEQCTCQNNFKEKYFEKILADLQQGKISSSTICRTSSISQEQALPVNHESLSTMTGGGSLIFLENKNTVPLECLTQSARYMKKHIVKSNSLFQVCAHQGVAVGQKISEGYNSFCNGKQTIVETGAPCISENYAKGLWYIFHEVARCVDISAREVFPLLNRESGLLLNILSPTGTKCAGQLSKGAIIAINRHFNDIDDKNTIKRGHLDSLKFSELAKRCPHIVNLQAIKEDPQDEREDIFRPITVQDENGIEKFAQSKDACRTTENPYSCLLYSLSFLKKNELDIEAQLESWSKIYLGKKNDDQLIFHQDDTTLKEFQRKVHYFDSLKEFRGIKYRYVQIFKEPKKIAQLLTYWNYNGGGAVSSTLLRAYLDDLRGKIDRKENGKIRTQVAEGGIDTASFKQNFQKFVHEKYRWFGPTSTEGQKTKRRHEVSGYIDGIWESYQSRMKAIPEGIKKCACFSGAIQEEYHCE